MTRAIWVIVFCSITCFAQQSAVVADSIDKRSEHAAGPAHCMSHGWGPDIGFIESSLLYADNNGVVTESCIGAYEKDRNEILKIVFTSDGFVKKRSYNMKADFYYRDGKPFYIRIKSKRFNNRQKKKREEIYEFDFTDKLPDDMDFHIKSWLEAKIKELK